MNPRLKSSKKWTAFPKEYSEQIQTVFKENFAQYFDEAELIVEGRIYQAEVVLRVGFHQKGRLAQANFEVSMDYSPEKQDAVQRIHNCIDAAASMMMEFFENDGDVDFPYTWKEFPFQGQKLYLQYSTENSNLEAEANRLLGIDEGAMILEENEDEDALSRAEKDEELSPPRDDDEEDEDDFPNDEDDEDDEDEDSDDSGPRMFGGKPRKKKKDDLH